MIEVSEHHVYTLDYRSYPASGACSHGCECLSVASWALQDDVEDDDDNEGSERFQILRISVVLRISDSRGKTCASEKSKVSGTKRGTRMKRRDSHNVGIPKDASYKSILLVYTLRYLLSNFSNIIQSQFWQWTLTILTSDIASKLAMVRSIPTSNGSPATEPGKVKQKRGWIHRSFA